MTARPRRTKEPAVPPEAHMAALHQFAQSAHTRRGEPLAAILAELTAGMSDRKRLAVALDAFEGLFGEATWEQVARARTFAPEMVRDLARAEYRATVAFALILGDRIGGLTPPRMTATRISKRKRQQTGGTPVANPNGEPGLFDPDQGGPAGAQGAGGPLNYNAILGYSQDTCKIRT
jgi:hypothetical protein